MKPLKVLISARETKPEPTIYIYVYIYNGENMME